MKGGEKVAVGEATFTSESRPTIVIVLGIYWRMNRRRENAAPSTERTTQKSACEEKEYVITAARRGTSPHTAQSQRRKEVVFM